MGYFIFTRLLNHESYIETSKQVIFCLIKGCNQKLQILGWPFYFQTIRRILAHCMLRAQGIVLIQHFFRIEYYFWTNGDYKKCIHVPSLIIFVQIFIYDWIYSINSQNIGINYANYSDIIAFKIHWTIYALSLDVLICAGDI
jgi:hypothetical protein